MWAGEPACHVRAWLEVHLLYDHTLPRSLLPKTIYAARGQYLYLQGGGIRWCYQTAFFAKVHKQELALLLSGKFTSETWAIALW